MEKDVKKKSPEEEASASFENGIRHLSAYRNRLNFGMAEILPGLYLGSLRDANDAKQLTSNRIRHLVSVHESAVSHPSLVYLGIDALRIPVADCTTTNLARHFSLAIYYIHKCRLKNENVLVHCLAGVSRSATIVIAYLCTVVDISYFNALNHVTSKRPAVNPNFGFRMQLMNYVQYETAKERENLRTYFGENYLEEFAALWEADRLAMAHRADLLTTTSSPAS